MDTYREMDDYTVPEPGVPEVGLAAGAPGVVDTVYDGGKRLLVDCTAPEGPSALLTVEVLEDGGTRVLSYTKMPA